MNLLCMGKVRMRADGCCFACKMLLSDTEKPFTDTGCWKHLQMRLGSSVNRTVTPGRWQCECGKSRLKRGVAPRRTLKPSRRFRKGTGIQAPSALSRDHRHVICKEREKVGQGGTNLKQNAFIFFFFPLFSVCLSECLFKCCFVA